ncbi:reverse transcriptase [Phytophthora megakarya]|uniref:Reverse transcriptase n=1 Tax=Phytophthora megakarya TaxID=4795 RepID=A0A225W203_9STRA|nr:reverse transcriptase [Phytophthora megakarya]
MNSIRVVLSVVVALEYVTERLDADTAFLNSDLKERVYMEVLYGINNTKNMVYRLDKAIYGLKQMKKGMHVYVCLYVDDMIIAEDNQGAIALASNAGYNARTKHVDIKHDFVRENEARDGIEVNYIPTKDPFADMLTMGLGTKRLQCLMNASGIFAKDAQH